MIDKKNDGLLCTKKKREYILLTRYQKFSQNAGRRPDRNINVAHNNGINQNSL